MGIKGLNTGMTGKIHSLGLEGETYTDAFISDINKIKHPPNLHRQPSPRKSSSVKIRIGVLGHVVGWGCKGEWKRHS